MNFPIFAVVPMLLLLCPRHVLVMFRSDNVYKCFYRSTAAGATSSKPLLEASYCVYLTCKTFDLDLGPPAH
jgi:hypothetical protein